MSVEHFLGINDFKELSENPNPKNVILDVRSPEEFAEGHIPGSVNIPVDVLEDEVDQLAGYEKVYIHCRMGPRALRAMACLNDLGFKGEVFCWAQGGMAEWMERGYPTE